MSASRILRCASRVCRRVRLADSASTAGESPIQLADLPIEILAQIAFVDPGVHRGLLSLRQYAEYAHSHIHLVRQHFAAEIKRYNDTEWYRDGKLHRDDDRPAIIYADGKEWWWRRDILYYPASLQPLR
jgi:hypothetical protein